MASSFASIGGFHAVASFANLRSSICSSAARSSRSSCIACSSAVASSSTQKVKARCSPTLDSSAPSRSSYSRLRFPFRDCFVPSDRAAARRRVLPLSTAAAPSALTKRRRAEPARPREAAGLGPTRKL
eukprot:4823332-Prymnesium_polylepis.1